jgi:tetratricopeptide (TPR) repeat protein
VRWLCLVLLVACGASSKTSTTLPANVEAVALDGKHLARPALTDEQRMPREGALAEARALTDEVDRAIWVGRRLGYLHRYREAIDVFTDAIAKHPNEPRLYRFRGHRYITTRQLKRAIDDLSRATKLVEGTPDAIEPDGMPNEANIPTSTLHGNIAYHLALAYHLLGDFEHARLHFKRSFEIATTDDMRIAAAYWLLVSGDPNAISSLPETVSLLENHAYWALIQLFRDKLTVDEVRAQNHDAATIGYGIAMYLLQRAKDRKAAIAELRRVSEGDSWPSFGFIASEAALLRLQ